MTTERYERVQQRNAKRLQLEEDDKTVPPLDCSLYASEITDDIETDDNVVHENDSMHADLAVKMLTLSQAKEAVTLSQEELATIYGIPIFKAVCFQRIKFHPAWMQVVAAATRRRPRTTR